MKKLLALILALSLVLSFGVAFAEEDIVPPAEDAAPSEDGAAEAPAEDAANEAPAEDPAADDAAAEAPVEDAAADDAAGEDVAPAEDQIPAEGEGLEEGDPEAAIEDVAQEAVEANTVPADAVEIVAGDDASSVIINGIEYVYVCFTQEATWRASGAPVFWARLYEGEAYLFSMTTGQFLGKFAVGDLSYVNFTTDSYMRAGQTPWIPLAKAA